MASIIDEAYERLIKIRSEIEAAIAVGPNEADIIKSKFGGEDVTADRYRTHRALVRGEYDRFDERENEFISNLFYTDPQHPASPLLAYYLLWLLRQKLYSARNSQDGNVEAAHWSIGHLEK